MLRWLGGSFVVLVLAGCPDDGVATGGSSDTGGETGATTSGVSASETGAPPTTSPTTSGTTDPGGETTPGGSDGSSGTTDGVGSGSTGSSTGMEVSCGPPCDAPWVHEGDLRVDDETDLNSLRCLVEVTGELELSHVIGSPPAELGNLRRVGGLHIGWEFEMTSLAGLECLEFVGGTLSLVMNTKLADVSALAGLEHMGSLRIWSSLVTDLSLWDGVTGLRWIELDGVSGLARLPVPGPDTILRELSIERCAALTDLDALAGVPGDQLGSGVTLIDNPKLASIAGIGDLWQDGGGLILDSLPALASLAGVEDFAGGEASLMVLRHLPQVPDLEALAGIEQLDGLYLDDMPKVATLAPLAGLRRVNTLTLGSCSKDGGMGLDGLTTLAPLEQLEGLGLLYIARNGALTKLPQFTALEFELNEVELIDNPMLSAMQVDAFMAEHDGCASPPMACQCSEDSPNP